MKTIVFLCFIIISISNVFTDAIRGQDSSSYFLSKSNIFKFENVTDLIVFGDSFSSVDTRFKDMSYTGKNRSGGKNWPLQLKDIQDMKLWDFAVRGATVDLKITPRKGFKTDLKKEYKLFLDRMPKGKKYSNDWDNFSTLFTIWIGSNDIRVVNHKNDYNRTFDKILDEIFNIIEGVYDAGIRNFLLLNTMPLENSPINLSGNRNFFKDDVAYFNNAYKDFIKKFSEEHNDANIILYDLNNEYNYIIENCKQFNFTDCHNPWVKHRKQSLKKFFWSDYSHISYRANQILAKDIYDLLISLNK